MNKPHYNVTAAVILKKGKVLAESYSIKVYDSDDIACTIKKKYHSEKAAIKDDWGHNLNQLISLNSHYGTIQLTENEDIKIIGIQKKVIRVENLRVT